MRYKTYEKLAFKLRLSRTDCERIIRVGLLVAISAVQGSDKM